MILETGEKKLLTTNHGFLYEAKKSEFEEKIQEYQKLIDDTQSILDQLS